VRSLLDRDATKLARTGDRLQAAPRLLVERRRAALDRAGAHLQALSPLATLGRGYAIVRASGEALRDASSVEVGTPLDVELASGRLGARVEEIMP
jgi:exodeoxyribonuclease VII large subunit